MSDVSNVDTTQLQEFLTRYIQEQVASGGAPDGKSVAIVYTSVGTIGPIPVR